MQRDTGPIVNGSEHDLLRSIRLTRLFAMSFTPRMSLEMTEVQSSTKERGTEGCIQQPLPARNGSVSRLEPASIYEHPNGVRKRNACTSFPAILAACIVG